MKRILALLLSILMMMGLVTVSAVADETPPLVKKILFDFDNTYEGVTAPGGRANLSGRQNVTANSGEYSFGLQTSNGVWDRLGLFVTSIYTGAGRICIPIAQGLNIKGDVGFAFYAPSYNTSSYVSFGFKLTDGSTYFLKYAGYGTTGQWVDFSVIGHTYYNVTNAEDTKVLSSADFADDAENRVVELIVADGGTGDDNRAYACYVDDVYYETEPALCSVSIDGEEVEQIYEGQKFTFPEADGIGGYVTDDRDVLYSANDSFDITGDINFTSITHQISADDFEVSNVDYTGERIAPVVTSTTLGEDDYEVIAPEDSINVGTYEFDVVGLGHNFGKLTFTFDVSATWLDQTNCTADTADKVWTGEAITPEASSVFGDEVVISYRDNVDVGEASIDFTPNSDNLTGSCTLNFNILPKTITEDMFVLESETHVYDGGNAILPNIIYDELYEDYFSVEYHNNTDVGVGEVVITGHDNLTGEITLEFDITPKAIAESDFTFDTEDRTYTGEAHTPEVQSTLNSDDYTVTYEDNVNAGEGKIIVEGKGNYGGKIEKTFKINTIELKEEDFGDFEDVVFDGTEHTPAVEVKNELITENDYEVAYENNKNAGTATVTITGKGNFEGKITKTFDIATVELDKEFFGTFADVVYTGAEIKPAVGVKEALVTTNDYEVAYESNVNVGTATVKITGKGNFKGELTYNFNITAKDLDKAFFGTFADVVYTGAEIKPAVEVKEALVTTNDYAVVYENNVNVGTATVKITGKGNFKGELSYTFNISPAKITEADFVIDTEMVKYTGVAITKTVTSKLPADAYTVVYENNVNVGEAKIIVTAKGNYEGSFTKTFTISVPETKAVKKVTAKAGKKSVKISWKKVKDADGYAIEVSTSKKFKKKATKTIFVKAKKLKKTVKKLKAGKKYYVRVASFKKYKNDEGKTIKALGKWKKVKKAVKVK